MDKELLRVNGSRFKVLEEQIKGRKEVEIEDLSLKHKVLWSKTVKKLPPNLCKELRKEDLPEEKREATPKVKVRVKAETGRRRLRLRTRRCALKSPRLPDTDFLKLVYSSGKRQCKLAAPDRGAARS